VRDAALLVTSSDEEPEVVDGLPVLADDGLAGAPTPAVPAGVPAVVGVRQVAALAATGFAAGAATVALAHRRRAARVALGPARGRRQKRLALGEVVTSNSFLVDVHLLRRD